MQEEGNERLPSELQAHVMDFLPPNEQALVGRLVHKGLNTLLSSNRTARFRLPLPPSAGDATWQPHLHQAFKELLFTDKLDMMSAAAASGSKVNLGLAWGLLRPCLHPELLLLPHGFDSEPFYAYYKVPDPGTAAVRAGHAATVLPWLVDHGCPLHPHKTLEAAAEHCDLAGLQAVGQLLGYGSKAAQRRPALTLDMRPTLSRAAGLSGGLSSGGTAIAKLTWLLRKVPATATRSYRRDLLAWAMVGAASAGSLPVLAWLRGQGLDLASTGVSYYCKAALCSALQGGHVAVADWLVDEAGCPQPSGEAADELEMWTAAAEGGHVASLRWLLGRGLPVCKQSALQAASAGRLEALRFLHTECGVALTVELFRATAGSHSLPTAAWLLQAGCPMDPQAYQVAAEVGDADMVVWLAQEARCPWERGTIAKVLIHWPRMPSAARRGLRRAVEALEEAGCPLLGMARSEVGEALYVAAMYGDLVLLRRLHEELGVGLGRRALGPAAKGGCEAVLEWLVGAGLAEDEEEEEEEDSPCIQAGCNGDLGTLQCLMRLGVGLGQVLHSVPLPVLRWLVEQGAPWDMVEMYGAKDSAVEAKQMRKYGDSVAWLEARLGREVWRAVSDSDSGSGSEEASGSGSEEGGSGDGSVAGSEGRSE